jgi:hypothetical protein
VDVQNKLLTAYSDHLTIFDYKADDWEAARLPSLEAFQVSTFTGAATYALPLWVPPGPAGLQPEVSLSYHSAASDQATAETQAAWVGMGLRLQRAGRTDPPGRRQGPAQLPVSDSLGRLPGKHYRTDDNCPASPTYHVSFTYDQGTNGKGRRTSMVDPSGSSAWRYSPQGQVVEVGVSTPGDTLAYNIIRHIV